MTKILQKTKELLETGWTRERAAVDQAGQPVPWISQEAVAWSLVGAVKRAQYELRSDHLFWAMVSTIAAGLEHTGDPMGSLLVWNRDATQTEVLALVTKAIARECTV